MKKIIVILALVLSSCTVEELYVVPGEVCVEGYELELIQSQLYNKDIKFLTVAELNNLSHTFQSEEIVFIPGHGTYYYELIKTCN